MPVNYEVRKAGEKGVGLFTLRPFQKGELIYVYPKGRTVKESEIYGLPEKDKNHLDWISEGIYEIVEPPGCFINHSCNPIAEERDRRGYALRDITIGEEITVDYERVCSVGDIFSCRCGSAKCRGTIGG